MSGLNEIISPCMLFTMSLFSIPTILQIYYNIFPFFIITSIHLLIGILFHINFILTHGNPNIIIKIFDHAICILISGFIIIYGKNSTIIILISSSAPVFYILELVAIKKYKIKHNLIGSAGLHSLLHISTMTASSYIVFYVNDDYEIFIDTILILSGFFIGMFLFFLSMIIVRFSQ
tara:strand:- start:2413 stop:2940 length:528 start_codon:yes stop_codon:yes gene_type:complete